MKIATVSAAFVIVAAFAFACTTTTTTTTSGTDAGATNKDAGKEGGSSSSSSGSTEEEDSGGGSTCSDTSDQQACLGCCAEQFPNGATKYQAAVQACVCKADNCATDCESTYCASTPKNPDATCQTCFQDKQQSGACNEDLTKECGGDKDCADFYGCLTDSGCDKKK